MVHMSSTDASKCKPNEDSCLVGQEVRFLSYDPESYLPEYCSRAVQQFYSVDQLRTQSTIPMQRFQTPTHH